jgi:hypothetical protein
MFTYLRCIRDHVYHVPHERQKELETWRSYTCMNVLFKFTCVPVLPLGKL